MSSVYSFIRAVGGKLGVGTSDLGLERPASLPLYPLQGPGYAVQRALLSTRSAYAQTVQTVPVASPKGSTGSFFHGSTLLTRLAKTKGK